jgi:hypothetical protein
MTHQRAVIDTDPLGVIRAQLVAAAAERTRRHRRHRRLLSAAAAAIALLAAAAGAAALTDFSTGVGAVDRMLQTMPNSATSPSGDAVELPAAVERDLRPGPGGASQALRVPWGNGEGVAVAYLTRDGEVCSAMADAQPEPRDRDPVGVAGGCMPPDILARIVEKKGGSCCGILGGPSRLILDGYVGANAVSVGVRTSGAPVEAELTDPWTPDSPGARPLRYFVAVVHMDADAEQPPAGPRIPPIDVRFHDGKVTTVEG